MEGERGAGKMGSSKEPPFQPFSPAHPEWTGKEKVKKAR